MNNTTQPSQQPVCPNAPTPQDKPPRKKFNYVGMIGFGLILLSICIFSIAPDIAIYCWIFGMVFSFVGLAFKPRWMAAIGAIISSIVIIFFILLIFVIRNPGPPGPNSNINGVNTHEDVAVDDSLLLDEVEIDDLAVSDSAV